jgi:hypothetical protein
MRGLPFPWCACAHRVKKVIIFTTDNPLYDISINASNFFFENRVINEPDFKYHDKIIKLLNGIVVKGFHLKPGSTIIVEQPEMHLHPRVQAELGDLFIEFYKEGKFSIIETHSEHLILRIQRRIAEGKIEKSRKETIP